MGHVNRRRSVRPLQLADFDPHLDPKVRIEIGERFIEHQKRWLDDQSARQRHPLLLSPGQCGGIRSANAAQPDPLQHRKRAPVALVDRIAPLLQAERHVVAHRQVREQRDSSERRDRYRACATEAA